MTFLPERVPARELVEALMEVLEAAGESPESGLVLDTVAVTLPIELELDVEGGRVRGLRASPPTQRTETTVLPVLHRLTLSGVVVHAG